MIEFAGFKFKLHFLMAVVVVHGAERSGLFEGITHFNGFSMDATAINKRVCSVRCLVSSCRGIHFDGGICKILYETNDIPESERNKFNPISLTSNEENLLVNVYHVCSPSNPCHHGGVCEAVDWIYQCNCDSTDHYGPLCETAGNAWTAPDGWDTLYPQLHLNLDDPASGTVYGGAVHLATQNGYGFETDGSSGQYVDLGNWTGDTCFVDLKECTQGFTLLAFMKATPTGSGHSQGFISNRDGGHGAALVGSENKIAVRIAVNNSTYVALVSPDLVPTDWVKIMVIFKANVGVEIYIDNVLKSGDTLLGSANITPDLSGHIVIGRYGPTATYFGIVTVDWLTIWDRVLTEEERNLAHLD